MEIFTDSNLNIIALVTTCTTRFNIEQKRQCMYEVILKSISETIVAVEKQ
jgi:hypothetical protein